MSDRRKRCKITANIVAPNAKDEDITLASPERNRGAKHTDPNTLQKSVQNKANV